MLVITAVFGPSRSFQKALDARNEFALCGVCGDGLAEAWLYFFNKRAVVPVQTLPRRA